MMPSYYVKKYIVLIFVSTANKNIFLQRAVLVKTSV